MHIFQSTSIALVSQSHKDFDHDENNLIYSKATRLTEKKKLRKVKTTAKDCKNPTLQLQIESFRNLQLSGSFLYTGNYSNFTLTPLVILITFNNTRHIFHRIINPFSI